ncbi:hypothetical protein TH61_16760 [Rufibacter sp. DG15C]|uniref:hypothetical protein n=1 Tax=Rufibacter sp. DG15C TaxID=1379909 RepID=UPI00078B68DA|nr:hypothetical protein [Rufibacter sp. DG15C]AMM52502.1 hypothetical protein TH61_16760 [Rufibacter sp. DG15C]
MTEVAPVKLVPVRTTSVLGCPKSGATAEMVGPVCAQAEKAKEIVKNNNKLRLVKILAMLI